VVDDVRRPFDIAVLVLTFSLVEQLLRRPFDVAAFGADSLTVWVVMMNKD
jgi:hypothetical protein